MNSTRAKLESRLARWSLRASLSALGAAAWCASFAACGGGEGPEGAILRIQFRDVRATAVDELRVRLTPQAGQRFAMTPPMSHGEVTVSVDGSDGSLLLVVPGSYVRANSVMTGTSELTPQLDIEVWSDDATSNLPPLVRATAFRGGESIAQGAAYVPAWPLALGSVTTIQVMCLPASMALCQGR